jgi:molybdate transport system ATP-binding protein
MITHDIEDVLELADIAFVYDNGQVVREVNLSDATSRERGIRELSGGVALEEPPLRQRLRQLLSGLARG